MCSDIIFLILLPPSRPMMSHHVISHVTLMSCASLLSKKENKNKKKKKTKSLSSQKIKGKENRNCLCPERPITHVARKVAAMKSRLV